MSNKYTESIYCYLSLLTKIENIIMIKCQSVAAAADGENQLNVLLMLFTTLAVYSSIFQLVQFAERQLI